MGIVRSTKSTGSTSRESIITSMKRTWLHIYRYFPFFLVFSVILSSCGPLWGTNETPTAEATEIVWTFTPPPPVLTQTPSPLPPTETATPTETVTPTPVTPSPTRDPLATLPPLIVYYSQPGDTLQAVAARFVVEVGLITSSVALPEPNRLLEPDTPLLIPNFLADTEISPSDIILPDSELVFSPSAIDFDVRQFVVDAGGYLSSYTDYVGITSIKDGIDSIVHSAEGWSINPRLLLALTEYESGWVTGTPDNPAERDYPLGNIDILYKGLYKQLQWAAEELSVGYYGWRAGTLTELSFKDGSRLRLAPGLNAGSAALLYFFSTYMTREQWEAVIDPDVGFPAIYTQMFGDPWVRARVVEPLYPPALVQPELNLPFEKGQVWWLTGGPHSPWLGRGGWAALDFAPGSVTGGCTDSIRWVLASAPGLVVRSDTGVVVLDLDADGYEQTQWALLYLHIATKDRVKTGTWLEADDRIGHPSCEGGLATGTHVHLARKYNGEWILADGPLPFVLSGWTAHNGDAAYKGTMTRRERVSIADPNGRPYSAIERLNDE